MTASLESERLKYSPLTEEDHAEGFHRIFGNKEALARNPRGPSKTFEESIERMRRILPTKDNDVEYFVIFLKNDLLNQKESELIGMIGRRLNDTRLSLDSTAEIDFFFHPDHWNKGYATEALGAFISYLWSARPDVEKIRCISDEEHHNSHKVILKQGLKQVEWKLPEGMELPLGLPGPVIFELERMS